MTGHQSVEPAQRDRQLSLIDPIATQTAANRVQEDSLGFGHRLRRQVFEPVRGAEVRQNLCHTFI
jgi:hypothetical protein